MSVRNPTAPTKPDKPYPDFPLFAHANGSWAKKIRGKLVYFGPWDNPDKALDKYLAEKDALHAGRRPRVEAGGETVKDVVNAFLNAKQALVDVGELSPLTWKGYKVATDLLIERIGAGRLAPDLGPDDFAELRQHMAKRWGPQRLAKTIQDTRSVFKYAYEAGLIEKPMRFGPGFARPSKKVFRLERAKQGPKLFSADEVRRLVDAAGVPMKAMLLLGINAGFGNSDCANLPLRALDLDGGWIDYPRPKTGVPRKAKLWPATIEAIKAALAKRHTPKDQAHAGLVFVTKYSGSWAKTTYDNPVTKEMAKLTRKAKITGRRGRGFYTLRHTFRTVADACKDQVAVDHVMGHARDDMASLYRESIDDARLVLVADFVLAWYDRK